MKQQEQDRTQRLVGPEMSAIPMIRFIKRSKKEEKAFSVKKIFEAWLYASHIWGHKPIDSRS